MTNILIRLRRAYTETGDDTFSDAADEIAKLRAQVVSLQSSLDAGPPVPGKKTPDALTGDG